MISQEHALRQSERRLHEPDRRPAHTRGGYPAQHES